jgi:hypothetical protein
MVFPGRSGTVKQQVIEETMSLYGRTRKKRIRDFQRLYASSSKEIQGWMLWQVHEVPSPSPVGCEIDFWVYTGKDVILLTVQNGDGGYRKFRTTPRDPLHLKITMPFHRMDYSGFDELVRILISTGAPKQKTRR